MMKIGFDAKRLFHNQTGLGQYSRALVKSLSAYFPQNQYFLFDADPNKSVYYLEFSQLSNVKIISPKGKFPLLWRLFGICNQINDLQLDIFHGLSNEIPLWSHKCNNTTFVCTIHDVIFKSFPSTYNFTDKIIYNFKVKYALNNSYKILTVSNFTKNDILKYFIVDAQKITVSHLSCAARYYSQQQLAYHNLEEQTTSKRNYLIYVGSITPRKDLITVINALSILIKSVDIELYIIGKKNGTYYNKVAAIIKQKQLQSHVVFNENISLHLQMELLSNSIAMVYPSKYEGFGMPIIEAQLCQTAVITCNATSLPEIAGNAALFISPANYKQLAQHVLNLINQPQLRANLVKQGLENAYNYHPKIISSNLHRFYKDLIIK